MPHTHEITPDLVEAYELSRRKAFLLLRGDAGDAPHEYVRLLDTHAASSLDTFVGSLEASGRIVKRHPNPELNGKADVLAHVPLKTEHLEAVADVLVRSDPGSSKARHYEPHLVVGTHTVTREQKIRLAFLGFVVDARFLKREIQEEALRKRLIPYIPERPQPFRNEAE